MNMTQIDDLIEDIKVIPGHKTKLIKLFDHIKKVLLLY